MRSRGDINSKIKSKTNLRISDRTEFLPNDAEMTQLTKREKERGGKGRQLEKIY